MSVCLVCLDGILANEESMRECGHKLHRTCMLGMHVTMPSDCILEVKAHYIRDP